MALQIHKLTDTGLVRDNNEDSIRTFSFNYQGKEVFCLVVADGVGGHQAGDVASELTVIKLEEKLKQHHDELDLASILVSAVKEINKFVYQQSQLKEQYKGMGTTLTVAIIIDKQLIVGHVGDSRAYLFQDDKLNCITNDHSLVGEMVKNGQISREEARMHPRRNIILQAIGLEDDVEVDIYTEVFKDQDILLLCTDGLSDLISEDELQRIFEQDKQSDILPILKGLAVERGAHDNFSIITAQRVGSELND